MNHLRDTISLCPTCRQRVAAKLVEEDGSVFMSRRCPEHGDTRHRIVRDSHIYTDLMSFFERLEQHFPVRRARIESCALTTTLRCDAECPICFAGDKDRVMPAELSLEQIRERIEDIRGQGIMFRLTGGEPTEREDLPDIIELVRDSGNYPVMVSNALKLQDRDYLRILKDRGLWGIAPWMDTIDNNQTYRHMRGQELVEQREQVLANVSDLGLKLIVFFVCVKGVNEGELAQLLKLPGEYPNLVKLIVMPYMHRGTKGFSEENEYALDEFWEVIANATGNFSLDELYTLFKAITLSRALRGIYSCPNSPLVLMPRSGRKEDALDPQVCARILKRFDELLKTNPSRARRYYLRAFGTELLKKGFLGPLVNRYVFRKKDLADTFIPPAYFWLQSQHLFYPQNYDEDLMKRFCSYYSVNPGLDKQISFCEFYNRHLKT